MASLHAKLQLSREKIEHWCMKDIKKKYCHKRWREMRAVNRSKAFEEGWRRPWDGVDGDEFHVRRIFICVVPKHFPSTWASAPQCF